MCIIHYKCLCTAQRRRGMEDEQSMRSYLSEGDLISAEVHSVFADGSLSLHMRSLKYGKVRNYIALHLL